MSDESIRLIHASGACEIDLARREIRVLGSPVPVGGRAFEIIEVLARSAGELVTKDELMKRIWPGATVTENTLHVHTAAVRKALGPNRRLLKTESGRGYRLIGDWAVRRHDAARPPVGLQRMRVDGESPITNFPATVTHLIGRTTAVARLRDLMSAYRVVTLTGPGGIGKTSLALKAARGIVGEFADGGWRVELASLSDPALVPTAAAGVLRLSTGPTSVTPDVVARSIGDKRLLLVLDNCEHLIGAVATLVETLLALCANVSIITTSRETLRIQGEYVYRVPPLEIPAAEQVEATQILEHSAPALFITRMREFDAAFSLNARNVEKVAAICRRLDGIPLAIEFAAARAVTLGVEQVAAGLQDRFALLTTGRRTALPRHRTLRATLDWSYQLLTMTERDLLHCLAIFAGPFSLDAACAVANEAMTTADGVMDLIGKSMVLNAADRLETGFRLLETTRAYAFDRLTESGAHAEIAGRHVAYLLKVLGSLEDEQRSKPQDVYLAALRRHADEIHAALEWVFSATGDREIGLALTIAAVPLWFELSQIPVARGRVEQALPYAESGSVQEMRLYMALGQACWYTGVDPEPAFTHALGTAERLDATTERTMALWGLWTARRGRGDYPAALTFASRYADAAARAGNADAIHLADRILGLTHHALGQQQRARDFTERAVRQARALDPRSGIGYQVETPIAMPAQLARILWMMGFPDQATDAARAAVTAALDAERSFPIAYAAAFAGLPVALWTGAEQDARHLADLLAAHVIGNDRMERWAVCFARVLRLRAGNEGEALVGAFIEARADPPVILPFADLALDATILVPSPEAEPFPKAWNTPELLRVDAELLLWHDTKGAAEAAEAKLLRALEIAREQMALSWELRAAASLARLWWRQGRATESRFLLAATYGKFTEGFNTNDLVSARKLMMDLESDQSSA